MFGQRFIITLFENRGKCFYQEGSELSYLNGNTRIFGRLN